MRSCKLLLTTVTAGAVLGACIGSASARSFSTTTQTWRATFLRVSFQGVFGNISCQVTLEGSLHSRTIAKSVGALIGYVTRASLGPCAEGRATILRESLPWHVRYASFTSALPNITLIGVSVVGASFRIQEPLSGCLATTTAFNPATITLSRGTATGAILTATVGGSIPTDCFGLVGTLSSFSATVSVLNSSGSIVVTLI